MGAVHYRADKRLLCASDTPHLGAQLTTFSQLPEEPPELPLMAEVADVLAYRDALLVADVARASRSAALNEAVTRTSVPGGKYERRLCSRRFNRRMELR